MFVKKNSKVRIPKLEAQAHQGQLHPVHQKYYEFNEKLALAHLDLKMIKAGEEYENIFLT